MTEKEAAALWNLAERWKVGVWQFAGRNPDDYDTASWLVREGHCSFVNTDLPNNFRKDVKM